MVGQVNQDSIKNIDVQFAGIGLREPHYDDFLKLSPQVSFIEVHSENYFLPHSRDHQVLLQCREKYPISLHGIGLSLGSAQGISKVHLKKLKSLIDVIDPAFISEHVSWSGVGHRHVPDLLPIPYTQESFEIIAKHVDEYQNFIGRQIFVENPSSYLRFKTGDYSETEFLNKLADKTGCKLLLDINNIYVSAYNMGFSADEYLSEVDESLVGEIHLAGFQINNVNGTDIYVDAHNHPVYDPVWELFENHLDRLHKIPVLIEWDSELPPLPGLLAEAEKADHLKSKYFAGV